LLFQNIKGIAFFIVPLFLAAFFTLRAKKKGTVPFFFLRYSPFAVVYYSFMGCGLAAAAISARE
jgi:hypothetical protein